MKKSKTLQIATVAAVASLLFCGAVAQAADMGWNGKAEAPRYQEQVFPPWQHGGNNPAMHEGLEFTVPEVDDLADFHGSIDNPQLTIFVGGNYYFAMAPLVKAFEKEHPALRGKIYYETLPPGILIKQMKQGGTITIGNMTWTIKPDVYAAGLKKVNAFIKEGLLQGPAVPYVTNDLTIMIPKGNPAHITGLQDLGKPGVRLSMPNPAWEGVARQIKMSLTKAGGPALEKMVYDTKVKNGETILTHIHHRQTPLFLMQGLADAGVTWKSEAIFQEQAGHPIANVAIPAKDNTTAIYASAVVKGAAHPKWAKDWVNFLKSPTALQIFEHYGFKPYTGK
ncbi:substrate-binding domain-containing protein [Acidithiobacillus sp.]|jgi:ABC-type molybdate transport system substrate-binding protein|uniref:substrate-binding domain-containing protein n=1 Tax=Acidithiobacillus sp. TaxID=1872118 RepID=UPI00262D7BB1|nr:substrate-binding domain-containing protein [Acidithiobacillus sp.]